MPLSGPASRAASSKITNPRDRGRLAPAGRNVVKLRIWSWTSQPSSSANRRPSSSTITKLGAWTLIVKAAGNSGRGWASQPKNADICHSDAPAARASRIESPVLPG